MLLVHSVVWSLFPQIVLDQRGFFGVVMLKSSFNNLGATMKPQKWSKNEALGWNYMFKDELGEYYRVFSNKCTLKSFMFLASNLDIHLTWTNFILIITF